MKPTKRDPNNNYAIAAIAHLIAAQDARRRWDGVQAQAMLDYGDCDPISGSRSEISGIRRAHWPDPVKEALRFYAQRVSEQTDRALTMWRLARRRLNTFKPYLEIYRRLPSSFDPPVTPETVARAKAEASAERAECIRAGLHVDENGCISIPPKV